MNGVAFVLVLFGLPIWVAGSMKFLVIVYRSSVLWFFGCLFIPYADLVYFLLNIKQTWRAMLICTVGCVLTVLGAALSGPNFLR